MKTKNFFVAKFVAVTLMLGFFSPTVNIQEVKSPEHMRSMEKVELSQGLLATLTTSKITFSLFTQVEAKKKYKKHKKIRRKARRRANRRALYRHHRHHSYHDRRREHRRDVAGALIIGGIVGAALNEAAQDK